ncbi:MAG: DUF6089 family protein [Flavobacteriales bacterium]
MKRSIWLFLLPLLFLGSSLNAQYYWDVGARIGGSNYLGEMGGEDQPRRDFVYDLKMGQTSFLGGAFARYKFNSLFSLELNFNYARIQGADSLSTYGPRRARNLSFRNDIKELSLKAQIFFYNVYDVGNTGRYILAFRSYAFAGIAGYHHSPKAYYKGEWHKLRPLKTEGQSEPYPKFGFSIPKGVGLYFTYKKQYRFGWEFGWRTTFTDYLDDASTKYPKKSELESELAKELYSRSEEVYSSSNSQDLPPRRNYTTAGSPRGDPSHNDSYLFTSVSFSYVFRGRSRFSQSRYSWLSRQRRLLQRKTRTKF